MQCDMRFFAREGRYGVVQVRRGAMPDAYSHWTVLRAVGLARAAELLLTGRTFGGDELERLGVANRVLPAAEVLPAARELARDVAANAAPLSVAVSKRLLWEAPAAHARRRRAQGDRAPPPPLQAPRRRRGARRLRREAHARAGRAA